jgi:hypothetical protein
MTAFILTLFFYLKSQHQVSEQKSIDAQRWEGGKVEKFGHKNAFKV